MVRITARGITKIMMASPDPREEKLAKQTRKVALVIAGTIVLWLLVQMIGAQYGWPLKYALLVDLAAGAAFIWALVVTYQIWRARRV